MILNPYNFIPLSAHIKLEINYLNELEHKCNQEVSLMALKDTFTLQEMNLDTKNLSNNIKIKNSKLTGIKAMISILVITIGKFLEINI